MHIKVEDVFFEEQMILIAKAKGRKSRYVPILPELAQELHTHLGQRTVGYLFETNRTTCYSPRRIQYIVKETAEQAQITKRVYPHLLRHSVATTLLERGMPIEQIQKFPHSIAFSGKPLSPSRFSCNCMGLPPWCVLSCTDHLTWE